MSRGTTRELLILSLPTLAVVFGIIWLKHRKRKRDSQSDFDSTADNTYEPELLNEYPSEIEKEPLRDLSKVESKTSKFSVDNKGLYASLETSAEFYNSTELRGIKEEKESCEQDFEEKLEESEKIAEEILSPPSLLLQSFTTQPVEKEQSKEAEKAVDEEQVESSYHSELNTEVKHIENLDKLEIVADKEQESHNNPVGDLVITSQNPESIEAETSLCSNFSLSTPSLQLQSFTTQPVEKEQFKEVEKAVDVELNTEVKHTENLDKQVKSCEFIDLSSTLEEGEILSDEEQESHNNPVGDSDITLRNSESIEAETSVISISSSEEGNSEFNKLLEFIETSHCTGNQSVDLVESELDITLQNSESIEAEPSVLSISSSSEDNSESNILPEFIETSHCTGNQSVDPVELESDITLRNSESIEAETSVLSISSLEEDNPEYNKLPEFIETSHCTVNQSVDLAKSESLKSDLAEDSNCRSTHLGEEEATSLNPVQEKETMKKIEQGELVEKLADLEMDAIKIEKRNGSSERDSANHSPSEVMLASPSISNFSDAHSEGSSDSGKGHSDVATSPSRTPARGSSLAGDTAELSLYEFILPQVIVGRLIGRHGAFLHEIRTSTNTNIFIKRHPDTNKLKICAVEGSQQDIQKALAKIRQKFPIRRYPELTLEKVSFVTINNFPPLKLEDFHLTLVEGVNNDVILSSLITAAHFFLQQPSHPSYASLVSLNQVMNQVYSMDEAPILETPIKDAVCAAHTMGGWYRAQIISVNEEKPEISTVRFLDYGGYLNVESTKLRQIRGDLLALPFQAVECYLANVAPKDEDGWTEEAKLFVQKVTYGKILQAQIYEYAEDGTPLVYLYSSFNNKVILINEELVTRGYGVLTTNNLEEQQNP